MSGNMEKTDKCKKKTIIKAIVTLVIIAILIISISIFITKNNAKSQIETLKDSVNNNDAKTLSLLLSTNSRDMTEDEGEHLIDYFKKDKNFQRFNKQLAKIKDNVDSKSGEPELGAITDKRNKTIINFSKNGKKYMFLDRVSMQPQYRDVYVKELDNTSVYNFDNKHQVPVDKNKVNKLGSFVVGSYDVPVKKEFTDGSVTGAIKGEIQIDTDKLDEKNRIIAKQDFNQTQINIKLHNDKNIDKKNRELVINGDVMSLDEGKLYGYFPNKNSFSVKAQGELKGHKFNTKSVNVLQGTTNNSIQTVNLYFNDKNIDKVIKEDKRMEKELEKFIKRYMDILNKAYKNKSYDEISKYIKSDSSAENFMKPKFKQKQSIKYKNVDVEKVKRVGKYFELYVQKKYKNYDVKNIYKIEVDNGEPKIIKIDEY